MMKSVSWDCSYAAAGQASPGCPKIIIICQRPESLILFISRSKKLTDRIRNNAAVPWLKIHHSLMQNSSVLMENPASCSQNWWFSLQNSSFWCKITMSPAAVGRNWSPQNHRFFSAQNRCFSIEEYKISRFWSKIQNFHTGGGGGGGSGAASSSLQNWSF